MDLPLSLTNIEYCWK